MSALSLVVWSDYVCPWCYIGRAELMSLRGEFDFTVDWRPFMLNPTAPEEGWPLPPHVQRMKALGQDPLSPRARALGLTMVERDLIPPSRRAHQATEYARAHGKLSEFHASVLRRYWSEGQDLNTWGVLGAAAVEVGLDAKAMEAQVEHGDFTSAVEDSTARAHALGIGGVPAFVVNERFLISGAQTAQVFREAFSQLSAA